MFLSENYKKSGPILEHSDLPKIEDNYKCCHNSYFENQEKALAEDRVSLEEWHL